MGIKLTNTLSGRKESFVPRKDIRMFCCGPSVTNYIHLGNLRTFLNFDMMVRFIRSEGHLVKAIQNITDINEDIVEKSQHTGKTWKEFIGKYEKDFLREVVDFELKGVDHYIPITKHIPKMIEQIGRLLKKGFAYTLDQGVFFRSGSDPKYGDIGRRNKDKLRSISLKEIEGDKSPKDYPLWIKSKNLKPVWNSPWGLGRPGWNIQDAALIEKIYGKTYDIHMGAEDLIYPHQESVISLLKCLNGDDNPLQFLLNGGYLTKDGEKMSKSLGNVVFSRDAKKEFSPETLRFFLLFTSYRDPLEYSSHNVIIADQKRRKMIGLSQKVKEREGKGEIEVMTAKKRFRKYMCDDFDTPNAIKEVERFLEYAKNGTCDRKQTREFLDYINSIFRIGL